jgi:hypothetical protein
MKGTFKLHYLAILAVFIIFGNSYSQEAKFSYTCPADGSSGLNPEQNIILKYTGGMDSHVFVKSMIRLHGTLSGNIDYTYIFCNNDNTLLLKPCDDFIMGEKVEVQYTGGLFSNDGKELSPFTFHFSIINHDRDELHQKIAKLTSRPEPGQSGKTGDLPVGRYQNNNLPEDYPPPTIYNYEQPDNRFFFYNTACRNVTQPWESYITIVDAYGTPVYYNKSHFYHP